MPRTSTARATASRRSRVASSPSPPRPLPRLAQQIELEHEVVDLAPELQFALRLGRLGLGLECLDLLEHLDLFGNEAVALEHRVAEPHVGRSGEVRRMVDRFALAR